LGLKKYSLYLHDYGGPVGFHLMVKHPERVQALIVSNANAYQEGLGKKWALIAEYWKDPKAHPEVFANFVSQAATEARHTLGTSHPEGRAGPGLPGQAASLNSMGAYPPAGAPTLILWDSFVSLRTQKHVEKRPSSCHRRHRLHPFGSGLDGNLPGPRGPFG
jgi:pimeloyl-ACP methyl ester carboxylesterase